MTATMTRPVHRDGATETYGDVQKWIVAIVSDFRRAYESRESREDMMQEANLAFMSALADFDPARGGFPFHLRQKIFSRLFNRYRRDMDRTSRGGCPAPRMTETDLSWYAEQQSPLVYLWGDAKALADAVMGAPGVTCPDSLWVYMRDEMGWCARRFLRAYAEVQEVLG